MERSELEGVIRAFDELADCFAEHPFRLPPPAFNLSQYLSETGYWVISQGKEFFTRVWQNPPLFWDLKRADVIERQQERSYLGIPEMVWHERFPDEFIPG